MNKERVRKSFNFIMILVLFTLMVFIVFLALNRERNPIDDVIDMVNKGGTFVEGSNGIYVNSESMNGEFTVISGCTLTKVDNVVVIIGDTYYKYRSSCLGTFVKGTGKTKDLNIRYSESNKTYVFDLDKKRYVKNYIINTLNIVNRVLDKNVNINLENYSYILKETQYEGHYYDLIDKEVKSLSLYMDLKKNVGNSGYSIALKNAEEVTVYYYNAHSFALLPKFYLYGTNFAAVEQDPLTLSNNRYSYNLKMYNRNDGLTYNLADDLPIIVNGVKVGAPLTFDESKTQDEYSSIFITFDRGSKKFIVLIGKDKKMCTTDVSDENKDEILYYEFSVKYNYLKKGFDKPEFVRAGYANEGCKHVDKIIGR